jgi:hypothetical protein
MATTTAGRIWERFYYDCNIYKHVFEPRGVSYEKYVVGCVFWTSSRRKPNRDSAEPRAPPARVVSLSCACTVPTEACRRRLWA